MAKSRRFSRSWKEHKKVSPAIRNTSPEGVVLLIAGETEILCGQTYIGFQASARPKRRGDYLRANKP